MAILIDSLLELVRHEYSLPPPRFTITNIIDEKEHLYLSTECNTYSEFDPHNKRKNLYDTMTRSSTIVATCPYGKVIAIVENADQVADIPWSLWGRIMRLYTDKAKNDIPFKIFFLANTHLRTFPQRGEICAENINGGYTYPGNRETIIIYRAEDATRVLLHELMHSCNLDNHANGVDQVEAETEAWAELVYVALLSQGNVRECNILLKKQSEWMIQQNLKVKKHMRQPTSKEFPWRYTIGKEEMWKKWNILQQPMRASVFVEKSLRLTCPPTAALQKRFKVRKESTIL